MAICLVATFVCGSTDDKQAEFDKLQESLREAKNYYESSLAQLDTSSRDDIIGGIDKAFDLNKQWVIDLSAYNGVRADDPKYDDTVADINKQFDEMKRQFKEDIKDLDDDALKQRVKDELDKRIVEIQGMNTYMSISG